MRYFGEDGELAWEAVAAFQSIGLEPCLPDPDPCYRCTKCNRRISLPIAVLHPCGLPCETVSADGERCEGEFFPTGS